MDGMCINVVWKQKNEGEECIVPFHKVYTTQKTFDYHNNAIERLSKNSFTGMEDQVKYRAVYRRRGEIV